MKLLVAADITYLSQSRLILIFVSAFFKPRRRSGWRQTATLMSNQKFPAAVATSLISGAKHRQETIYVLNPDTIVTVIMYLSPGKERFMLASTCRKVFSVYRTPPCWSEMLVFPVKQLSCLAILMKKYPVRKISLAAPQTSGMLGFDVLGGAGATTVARAIEASVHLHTLDISRNHIGRVGASAIGMGILKCVNLAVLDLHHNNLGSEGTAAICNAVSIGCRRLHTLDMSMVRNPSSHRESPEYP